jgi:DNA repair protein RecO (recombination protein O)
MCEHSTDAYVLKKTIYRESDYIVSLYTKDFGKISAIARNAKKSRKRYAGRLEQFLELRIKFKSRKRKINYLEDVTINSSLANITSDYDRFKWGCFILEYIEKLSAKEDPNLSFYMLLKSALEKINGNYNLNNILRFQYRALKCVGLNPDLTICYKCGNKIKDFGYLSIRKGGIVCRECFKTIKINIAVNDVKFVLNFRNNDQKVILKNISILTSFAKYHTGKDFKSEKFVLENNK